MSNNIISGFGIWIWEINSCSGGNCNTIIQNLISTGISWIAIKCGDSGLNATQWNKVVSELIPIAHANGIKVLAWWYGVPSTTAQQLAYLPAVASQCDGLIADCEGEWESESGAEAKAEAFLSSLVEEIGLSYPLYHSPFAVVNYHSGFPYKAFTKHCISLPQCYTEAWGIEVNQAMSLTDNSWTQFFAANPGSIEQVYPIFTTFGKEVEGKLPFTQVDLLAFINHYRGLPISFYSYDSSNALWWSTMRQLHQNSSATPPQTPPPQPNSNLPFPTLTPQQNEPSTASTVISEIVKDNPQAANSFLDFMKKIANFVFKRN